MIADYLAELASPMFPVQHGMTGLGVRRVQEWLCLHGFTIAIDSDFGIATEAALEGFQAHENLPATGVVNMATWSALVAPLVRAHAVPSITDDTLGATVVRIARQHLAQHPREVGGPNGGPWPRHYCQGIEGSAWCQGCASTLVLQACRRFGAQAPFPLAENNKLSLWVPWVVTQAKKAGRFQAGREPRVVPPGSMFFVPGEEYHQHVGIVVEDRGPDSVVITIEGNYTDAVISRTRRHRDLDYGRVEA